MKIAFIGGGNMAAALIGGLIQQGTDPALLSVVEIYPERRVQLQALFPAIHVTETFTAPADLVVLAVKPQQLEAVCHTLNPALQNGPLIISIAAGVRVDTLSAWLGQTQRIIRVMPNTPALIQAGISGLFASSAVSEADKTQAETLLKAVGQTVWVEEESGIDAITAISGSGPAYVFYFIEALEEAAQHLGFDAESAKKLALGTVLGAAQLAVHSGDTPIATLRAKVTSKGGTTEQAIASFDRDQIKALILRGVEACQARSIEMGQRT